MDYYIIEGATLLALSGLAFSVYYFKRKKPQLALPVHLDESFKKQILDKWERPLDKQPVHVDLPRLANKTEISVDGIFFVDKLNVV